MSHITRRRGISVADFRRRKGGQPLVCLTVYTTPMARLLDPICDMNAIATAQQPEDRERPRRFVRIRALQHQYRAMVGQAPNLRSQSYGSRRVQVHCVVGGIARDHGRLRPQGDGLVDGIAEAALGLAQVLWPVVQVREMSDADRAIGVHDAAFTSMSTLSA
jgi:hypothetical protein